VLPSIDSLLSHSHYLPDSIYLPTLLPPLESKVADPFLLPVKPGYEGPTPQFMVQPIPDGIFTSKHISPRPDTQQLDSSIATPICDTSKPITDLVIQPHQPIMPLPSILHLSTNPNPTPQSSIPSILPSTSTLLDFTSVCKSAGCNKKFKTQRGLAMHLSKGKCPANGTHQPLAPSEDQLIVCNYGRCQQTFPTVKMMNHHKVYHHNMRLNDGKLQLEKVRKGKTKEPVTASDDILNPGLRLNTNDNRLTKIPRTNGIKKKQG